jgi:acylphosphatase
MDRPEWRHGRTERGDGAELQESLQMAEDPVRRRVVATGRVQGVFFRDSARERACAHGVAGWVRNRSDGAVEAVLEGPEDAVLRVVRFFETGPPTARVDHVDVRDECAEGLTSFEIR